MKAKDLPAAALSIAVRPHMEAAFSCTWPHRIDVGHDIVFSRTALYVVYHILYVAYQRLTCHCCQGSSHSLYHQETNDSLCKAMLAACPGPFLLNTAMANRWSPLICPKLILATVQLVLCCI